MRVSRRVRAGGKAIVDCALEAFGNLVELIDLHKLDVQRRPVDDTYRDIHVKAAT